MRSFTFPRSLFPVVALAFLSGGCITFQEQTFSYAHDLKGDRVLIQVVYSGIHGDTGQGSRRQGAALDLTAAEKQELEGAVAGRQVFFFDNWLRVLDLDGICTELADGPDLDLPDDQRVVQVAAREWYALLAVNVHITNGPFFIDDERRLSAVQHITVSNVSTLIRAANRVWRLQAESLVDIDPGWTRATTIPEPLKLIGSQLIVRYPTDRMNESERTWGDTNRFGVDDGIATLTIGKPDLPRGSIRAGVAPAYSDNALRFVRARFGIAGKFDPAVDAQTFFASIPQLSNR